MRRGAESSERRELGGSTRRLSTVNACPWMYELLKIALSVASLQLYFLLQDREMCL